MPVLSSRCLFRKLFVAAAIIFWMPLTAQAKPAARPYPDSIPVDHIVSEMLRPYMLVYYSRDPIERVKAFYEQELGTLEELRSGQQHNQRETTGPVQVYSYVIHEVIAMEKAAAHPDRVAVEIFALRPPAHRTEQPEGTVPEQMANVDIRCRPPSDFFEPLFAMVATHDNRTWEQFNEVCLRYHHLESSLFLPSSEQDERGRTLNQAQAMIRQYHAENAPPVSDAATMEELAQQMQTLAMSGRMAEARALAEKMAEGLRSPDAPMWAAGGQKSVDWDGWVNLLEDIDRHAYRTRIMINTDPSTWPDRIQLRQKQ